MGRILASGTGYFYNGVSEYWGTYDAPPALNPSFTYFVTIGENVYPCQVQGDYLVCDGV
jgi:hypothetical protein